MNSSNFSSNSEPEERARPSTIRRLISRVVPLKNTDSSIPRSVEDLDNNDYSELPPGKPETLDNQTWFELNYFPLSEIHFETNRPLRKLLIQDLKNLDQLQMLGSGASGTVYRLSFCPRLAMKVFENKQYAEIALQHEASALAKLEGENHIEGGRVITMGLADKRVFWLILYSFIEGKSTSEYLFGKIKEEDGQKVLAQRGKLTDLYEKRDIPCSSEPERITRFLQNIDSHLLLMNILKDVLTGLQGLHEVGTIHRDIKPDNFMTQETKEGRVLTMLIDFGIACRDGFTSTEFMGTPPYVPPEGFPGENPMRASPQWDIYSVSKTLEYMIRGVAPLEGIGGFMQIQVQHYFFNEGSDNRIIQETKQALACLEKDLFFKGTAYYNWVSDILKHGGALLPKERLDVTLILHKVHNAIGALNAYKKVYSSALDQKNLSIEQLSNRTNLLLIEQYAKEIQKNIQVVKGIVESQFLDLENDNKHLKISFMKTLESLKSMQVLEYEGTLVKVVEGIEWRRTLKEYCAELENEFFHQMARLTSDTLNMLDRNLIILIEQELRQNEYHLFQRTLEQIQVCKVELTSLSRLTNKARETGKIKLDRDTGKTIGVDPEIGDLLEQSKNKYQLSYCMAFSDIADRFGLNAKGFWSRLKHFKQKFPQTDLGREIKIAFEKGHSLLQNESWFSVQEASERKTLERIYRQLETILKQETSY